MRSHKIKNLGRGLSFAVVSLCFLSQLSTAPKAQDKPVNEPRFEELPKFYQVNKQLYRGGQPKPGGIARLAELGINTIVNLRDDDERATEEGRDSQTAGIRYFNIPFGRMGQPTHDQIERVLALINSPENGVVFVHCARGEDRTGTVIAIYRISYDGWTGEQAKQEAKNYGMKFWQRGMRDYIMDYYRDYAPRLNGALAER